MKSHIALSTVLALTCGTLSAGTITFPTTADRVRVGDYLDVKWTAFAGPILIDYQKFGVSDSSWANLSVPNVPSAQGHYGNWQVINVPGSMRLRITDSTLTKYYGGVFTVVQLDLTAPGFLTSWAANSTQNITWTNSSNAVSSVKLEYTLNGADSIMTWVTIRDSVPISPATFAWTVPNFNTSYARVRIREIHSNTVIHMGNAFAISGAVGIRGADMASNQGLFTEGMRAQFTLAKAGSARVDLLDARGKVAATLLDGTHKAGTHVLNIDPAKFPAGVYTLRLRAGGIESSRRVVLSR